jgi:tRNA-guanine transglycosylase (EC 2.4.2.29)
MARAMSAFPFTLHATDGQARTGVLSTPRGEIRTPAFMPVGTAGTVKGLTVDQVAQTGADIILGNTYHLMLRPGGERLKRLGGLHSFMRWDKPILTDSGGYQVMSLSQLRKLDKDGVTFRSHVDGGEHRLTPERAMEIQADQIGADIIMQLDECPPLPSPRDEIKKAVELSLDWAGAASAPSASAKARTCSPSCKAELIPNCARFRPPRSSAKASTATPLGGSPWARGMRRCSARWTSPFRICRPIAPAISWA